MEPMRVSLDGIAFATRTTARINCIGEAIRAAKGNAVWLATEA
jgi:hypothetical protein